MPQTISETSENKRRNLFIILSAIFLTNALVAEMIGSKIFSLEATLGLAPANIVLFESFPLSFNLTAGVVLWPFVFITTDIINEYFGKEGVKKISYITAACIAYAFLMIWLAAHVEPADFWLQVNSKDPDGNTFNINYAFSKIFRQGGNIIIASLFAFLVGQILDAYIFQSIKKKTGDKLIWLRSTGSTVISQMLDSFVVIYIAFYLLQPEADRWTLSLVFSVSIMNYIYKLLVAIVLTPLIYIGHTVIDKYLGIAK